MVQLMPLVPARSVSHDMHKVLKVLVSAAGTTPEEVDSLPQTSNSLKGSSLGTCVGLAA